MTNSQGKTESPKSVADDLWSKPDETATNEKIKELCPIVITTIDCRATECKSADGKILSLKDADGKRLKNAEGKLLELKDIGVEMVARSSAEGRNEFKKDGKPVEAMDFE